MQPGAISLQGQKRSNRAGEDLAIVRDHHHSLLRRPKLPLERQASSRPRRRRSQARLVLQHAFAGQANRQRRQRQQQLPHAARVTGDAHIYPATPRPRPRPSRGSAPRRYTSGSCRLN
jgi:hypothetical protein